MARMDAHLASCPLCSEVFAETVRFALEEEAAAGAVPPSAAPLPFVRRRVFRVAASLAVAASLVLALRLAWRGRSGPAAPPLVAELSQAMGDRRFVEPRLTGGFRHGPLAVVRGGATQGLDAYPPPVLSAVATIRQRAEADPSPEALGALGITYLVSGDLVSAVKALESATAQAPGNARLQSDLAAAYLVRASRLDEAADLPRALEAAERAIALEAPPDEAWFNRALALEALHLVDAARKAWNDYLARDSASGWADEARRHLEGLPPTRQSSAEDDRARVRAALQEGPGAIDPLADEAPSLLRDHLQDDLLPAWADAQLTGRPDARRLRDQARLIGDALLRTTGDALARDAALALEPNGPASSAAAFRTQALGYRALHDAQHLYEIQQPSCGPFRQARRLLDEGGSPYAAWVGERIVTACFYPSEPQAALAELRRVEVVAEEHAYLVLLARTRWMQGLVLSNRADLTTGLDRYHLARSGFRAVRDTENEAFVLGLLAEGLAALGEEGRAWRERMAGLALLHQQRSLRRRFGILEEAALACLDARLPRTALHFQTAVVEVADRWSDVAASTDALVRRAALRHALGSDDQAAADLAEARRLIPRIGDASVVERMKAEADCAEGGVAAGEPDRAAASLERALHYFERASPTRTAAIHELLARVEEARGLDDEAERQLEEGIRELEGQRLSLRDAALQASFFDQAVPLFDEMVGLQVDRRHDPERALAFVERGRARQLADSIAGPPALRRAGSDSSAPAVVMPLDPGELQRELPDGVALVYLVSRGDRLLSWALTREASRFEERSLPADELRRLVAGYAAALERRAGLAVLREASARLYDVLVRPLDAVLRSQRALVLVPDGVLQSVAFAGLWDRRTGRYLVEDHLVGLAPSGTVFVRASAAAGGSSRDPAPAVLAVGNPRLGREVGTGLPGLPGAEAEAAEIAQLYEHAVLLTGSAATKHEFLARMRTSRVVHFAGHAVSDDAPWSARLLLAADPARADSGALSLHELDGRMYRRTRVVVLAACRTAGGAVSRVEGAWTLARPFLASGVPSVVASLWDVDDASGRSFFVAFHRALLAEGDPVLALRRTQVAFLRGGDPSRSHPASWAGFVSIGGLDPRELARVPSPAAL
jgi:CHAT domain-containing protein